jgi:hypothetical protein
MMSNIHAEIWPIVVEVSQIVKQALVDEVEPLDLDMKRKNLVMFDSLALIAASWVHAREDSAKIDDSYKYLLGRLEFFYESAKRRKSN